MSSHISSTDQTTDWTSQERKKQTNYGTSASLTLKSTVVPIDSSLHNTTAIVAAKQTITGSDWLAHTAIKVEGVNNSNNNLIIVNTWKQQPLSIMLHNYVPLLKYKYWIKITIISTNSNNSKRSNNKQIRFGCLNSLELYNVTMHKKVHWKICQNTVFQASVNQTARHTLTSLEKKEKYRRK